MAGSSIRCCVRLAIAGHARTTSASTSTRRRPIASSSRLDLLERPLRRARDSKDGTASASSCRRTRSAARSSSTSCRRSRAAFGGHRLMVRLVKGAYWDSEIKRAQVDGLDDYPVYTRKSLHRRRLPRVRKAGCSPHPAEVYPQFATHNAQTARGPSTRWPTRTRYVPGQYEFQCLHGMGEPLYEQVVGPRRARAGSGGRAASTRRSARTRRCSPTSCGACSRTAPTPRSSTASPITSVVIDAADRRPGRDRREAWRARRRRQPSA